MLTIANIGKEVVRLAGGGTLAVMTDGEGEFTFASREKSVATTISLEDRAKNDMDYLSNLILGYVAEELEPLEQLSADEQVSFYEETIATYKPERLFVYCQALDARGDSMLIDRVPD